MGIKATLKGFLGYMKMSRGKTDQAEADLAFAYENGSTSPAYLSAYGALLMQKHDYAKCLEVYRKALKSAQDGSDYLPTMMCSIITCNYKLGRTDTAIEDVKRLYDMYRSSTVFMLYGYLLMQAGRLEEALEINLEGYQYDQEDVAICDNLGQNYYLMGDNQSAKRYFEKALRIKYNMPDSCYFLAEIYITEENYSRAHELLEDAIDAPFSALTTVTKEQIQEKLDLTERLLKTKNV